ncbi:MAG TPA: preprotein translocase subunit SecE [Gaiellaceae bacterium]|nr:preprotein translocase subunit SecE [Gaiellaceae bacterium]
MARQSRQQRRERRAQQPALAGGPAAPASRQGRSEPETQRAHRESRGIPGVRFVQESIAELKKVEWPNQQAVVSGTAVVMVACLLVGTYLWLNDQLWQYVVHHVLLR